MNYATGIVCVCTEEYCDEMDPIGKSSRGIVQVFTTTKSGKRFEKKEIKFNNGEPEANTWSVRINRNQTYQTIIGFGSMFSDATALNIGKLSSKLQKQIISDLFSDKGLEYSMARTSVAGNDFSKRAYSYDDGTEDWDLKRFSLAEEDTQFKVYFIKIN